MAITNGTFETGDFTGWTENEGSGSGYVAEASISSSEKHAGSYGAKLSVVVTSGDGGTASIEQTTTTNATTLSFWYKLPTISGGWSLFRVFVSDADLNSASASYTTSNSIWTKVNLDISGLTARGTSITILVDATASAPGGAACSIEAYVDDLEFPFTLAGTCTTGTAFDGILSGISIPLSGISSTGTAGLGALGDTSLLLAGISTTATAGAGTLTLIIPLSGTSSTKTELDASLKLFLATANERWIAFDSGSSPFTIGETVTGNTSGASGTVISIVVTSGDWGSGTAAGNIVIGDVIGEFVDNENLNGSTAGDNAASANGTESMVGPKILRASVAKGIEDLYWTATLTCRGIYSKTEIANFRELEILMPDHTGTDQQVFLGIAPDMGVTQLPANKQTILRAVSHTWYLGNRQVPSDYLTNAVWVDSGVSGYVTTLEPSVMWTAFLGGALWDSVTGIYPANIVPVADWGSATRPVKRWGWNRGVKRWDAFQEMLTYCDYIFEGVFTGATNPQGVACPLSDINSYIGPAAVTLSDDTYIKSISKDAKDTEKPSLVTVTGARNTRRLNFITGLVEFTAAHTIVDGGTGAEATIVSCTKESGSWGSDAAGYIIISYDRTGSFVDGDTIIDALGAAYGHATMQGNDEPHELYDYYTYSYPETEPYRTREYFENTEENIDSTPLIEAYALKLYNFLQLDNTAYTVIFNKRTDLRLWQKIKITHRTDVIPSEWMRVVHISYDREPASRTVTCVLKNAAYVESMIRMKKLAKYSDAKVIEEAIKKYLAKELKIEDATIKSVSGDHYEAELINGEWVTRVKGTQ